MGIAFLVALVLTVIVFVIFGVQHQGTVLALKVTGRWSFFLFWPAYAGSAMARLWGPRFRAFGNHGRKFGLAFASAHLVHVGIVLWLFHIADKPPLQGGTLVFFSVGLLCTYMLVLFSLPSVREIIGANLWRILSAFALEYIALVFAADFLFLPLQEEGFRNYFLSYKYLLLYVPFAILLVVGLGLRTATHCHAKTREKVSMIL